MKKRFIFAFMFSLLFAVSALGFAGCDAPITYTVTAEQWDEATSLYWKNLTFEYTYAYNNEQRTLKLELLEDGSLHQSGNSWGEKYVYYNGSTWTVYDADGVATTLVYNTQADYIAGNYGDDVGFMGNILPMFAGHMDEFTFDETTNQYVISNYSVAVATDFSVTVNVDVKFENGNIVFAKYSFPEESDADFEVTFYDYGTTTIDFPASITEE